MTTSKSLPSYNIVNGLATRNSNSREQYRVVPLHCSARLLDSQSAFTRWCSAVYQTRPVATRPRTQNSMCYLEKTTATVFVYSSWRRHNAQATRQHWKASTQTGDTLRGCMVARKEHSDLMIERLFLNFSPLQIVKKLQCLCSVHHSKNLDREPNYICRWLPINTVGQVYIKQFQII